MERKIGEQFEYNGVMLKVIIARGHYCRGCYFYDETVGCHCIGLIETLGYCSRARREDETYIIFKEIPNGSKTK